MLHYHLLELCLLSLIIASHQAIPDTCKPKSCQKGPNFTFPFFFANETSPSYNCGLLGFDVTCNYDGHPVLQFPEDKVYVIANISYETQTLRVYDEAASFLQLHQCLPDIKNITLPPQFSFVHNEWLHIFPNCSQAINDHLWRYRARCDKNSRGYHLAIYESNPRWNDAINICNRHVVAPVENVSYTIKISTQLKRGFQLKWTTDNCVKCVESGGLCEFYNSTKHLKYCSCPKRKKSVVCERPVNVISKPLPSDPSLDPVTPLESQLNIQKAKRRKLALDIGVSLAAGISTVTCILIIIIYRKKLLVLLGLQEKPDNGVDIELLIKNNENLAPKRYRYSQLKGITNSFTENLGKGGNSKVYKGKLPNGRLVAVKILMNTKGTGEEFLNEVLSITRTSHVNVVALLGFCIEDTKRALIYEFMPNGSLDKFLPENTSQTSKGSLLDEKYFEIALGIARGLEYLHQGCETRILHFDIKPENILLDKDMKPKISDFGLAKLCPNRSSIVSMTGARGTAGYIAPEVFSRSFGEVSHKSDVYSYGMLVLEMIVGRKTNDSQRGDTFFTDWVYNILEYDSDANMVIESTKIMACQEVEFVRKKLASIGLWCIQTDPRIRPSIKQVTEMLEGKLECDQVPPRVHLSLTPTLYS